MCLFYLVCSAVVQYAKSSSLLLFSSLRFAAQKVWLVNDIPKLETIVSTLKILVETETNTTRVEFEIVHRLHSPAGLIILQGFH